MTTSKISLGPCNLHRDEGLRVTKTVRDGEAQHRRESRDQSGDPGEELEGQIHF